MTRRRTLLLPLLLAAPIAIGACGGSDEAAAPAAATSAVAAATSEAAAPATSEAAPATSEAAAPATSEAAPATSEMAETMDMTESTADATTEAASTGEPATTAAVDASAAVSKTSIVMGAPNELSLVVKDVVLKAGKVTFKVVNSGKMEHEAIAIPAPDGLEGLKKPDGSAKEKGAAGEIELAAGESGSFTVELTPGQWALVCNKPGHFAGGMAMLVTVV